MIYISQILKILLCLIIFSFSLNQKLFSQQYSKNTKIFEAFEITLDFKKDKNIFVDESIVSVEFLAPSGKRTVVDAFWDGESIWKLRFMPEELGKYKFKFIQQKKSKKQYFFKSIKNLSKHSIYSKGKIIHQKGNYHLSHMDGSPFFYLGCTAWNGALKSTDEEWDYYLDQRKQHNFNVIQFVTTNWRGFPMEYFENKPYEFKDSIIINPKYFQKLDEKFKQINQKGLVAAPIILWAWTRPGNPGNDLPIKDAVKLAKYIKSRYDAFHVLWNLAGDGDYLGKYEKRWKEIGQQVFGEKERTQSLVTLHPQGFQWYANEYNNEDWLDYVSYQTGHTNSSFTSNWKINGPVAQNWDKLLPRPYIDTEPIYEHPGIKNNNTDVRKSILQSLFSGPIAGTGYGAWTTWPWLRKNEKSINHGMTEPSAFTWRDGIESEGNNQLRLLYRFLNTIDWWKYRPLSKSFILEKKHEKDNPIFVLSSDNNDKILAYFTSPGNLKFKYEPKNSTFKPFWYNPSNGKIKEAKIVFSNGVLEVNKEGNLDEIFIIDKKIIQYTVNEN